MAWFQELAVPSRTGSGPVPPIQSVGVPTGHFYSNESMFINCSGCDFGAVESDRDPEQTLPASQSLADADNPSGHRGTTGRAHIVAWRRHSATVGMVELGRGIVEPGCRASSHRPVIRLRFQSHIRIAASWTKAR